MLRVNSSWQIHGKTKPRASPTRSLESLLNKRQPKMGICAFLLPMGKMVKGAKFKSPLSYFKTLVYSIIKLSLISAGPLPLYSHRVKLLSISHPNLHSFPSAFWQITTAKIYTKCSRQDSAISKTSHDCCPVN